MFYEDSRSSFFYDSVVLCACIYYSSYYFTSFLNTLISKTAEILLILFSLYSITFATEWFDLLINELINY